MHTLKGPLLGGTKKKRLKSEDMHIMSRAGTVTALAGDLA